MTESAAPQPTDRKEANFEWWLAEAVRRVVEEVDPLRIVLFGSRARGDASPGSDIDLLVVLEKSRVDRDTTVRIRRRLADMPFSKDVVVTTDERVDRYGALVGTILRPALREGRSLYERP